MTFTTMKVFAGRSAPQNVWEPLCVLNCELHGNGNDSYFDFSVVAKPTGDSPGYGYITDEEALRVTDWLLSLGAVVGEKVLVKISW